MKHWNAMAERGREAPAGYYEQPEIESHLMPVWNAFWDLSTERQLGMMIGPIPVSRIREYLRQDIGLHGPDYDRVRSIIRKMDDAYVGMLNRRAEDGPDMADSAKATDTEGVKRVTRGLGERYRTGKPHRK